MSHQCTHLLVACIDFRLGEKVHKWANAALGVGNYDLVNLAGSQKNFTQAESLSVVLKQIEISKSLHGITTVHIMAHEDCGAYGGSATLGEWDVEKEHYAHDLEFSETLIKEKFGLAVSKWIIKLNGDVIVL